MTSESRPRVCLLTGATLGIGRAAAEALVPMGMELVLVARDRARLEALAADLRRRTPGARVGVLTGDLSRMSDVRRIAHEFRATHDRLHVLANNAGAIFTERQLTPEGLERTLALNHLAYFVLTEELLPVLRASAPARIVNVASEAHRNAELDFGDLQSERRYSGWRAYQRSKLCNILYTRELARRLAGTRITANCLHPGFVASRFGDDNGGWFKVALAFAKRLQGISMEEGARTPIYLASSPDVAATSGDYFKRCARAVPSPAAQDDATAGRLWQESARLAGLSR